MRPLFFSWPADTASFLIDRQWMLGDAIMVAPILLEATNTVPAYFPSGKWYDLYNHTSIETSNAPQHLPVTVSALHLSSVTCVSILSENRKTTPCCVLALSNIYCMTE